MIDINELRRLAQAASHPTTKGRWIRLFGERTVYDRMEDGCRGIPVVSTDKHPPSSFEAACLDFIAAANPAAVIEILDRLEVAESEALEQARLNGMGSEREAALLAKLEAAEKERDALRAKIETAENDAAHQKALAASALRVAEGWERKCGELRAKIKQMEEQEPVGRALLCVRCSTPFDGEHYCPACGHHTATEEAVYAIPGAQPAPSVPDGFSREDLEAVADGLDGYEKTVNVGNVTGEGDDHLESTTAYAARFIRTMLAATPETKP